MEEKKKWDCGVNKVKIDRKDVLHLLFNGVICSRPFQTIISIFSNCIKTVFFFPMSYQSMTILVLYIELKKKRQCLLNLKILDITFRT